MSLGLKRLFRKWSKITTSVQITCDKGEIVTKTSVESGVFLSESYPRLHGKFRRLVVWPAKLAQFVGIS